MKIRRGNLYKRSDNETLLLKLQIIANEGVIFDNNYENSRNYQT